MITPKAIIPFIPGGADFAASRALFLELGAAEQWSAGGYAGLQWGLARFILQDFNERAFAQNLMLTVEVADLDAWWAAADAKGLPARFPGFVIKPPTDFPWGREVHFLDLAGVCWHVRES